MELKAKITSVYDSGSAVLVNIRAYISKKDWDERLARELRVGREVRLRLNGEVPFCFGFHRSLSPTGLCNSCKYRKACLEEA